MDWQESLAVSQTQPLSGWRKLSYVCWERWNRWDKITSLLFGGMIAAVLFFFITQPESEFIALDGTAYNNTQSVVSDTVPLGGTLAVVAGQKCNVLDHPVEVVGETVWRRVDVLGEHIPGFTGSREFPPGCTDELYFENPLPPAVGVGVWEFTGVETAHYQGKTHTRTWRTEPFTVK